MAGNGWPTVLELLKQEREKLNRAIEALEGAAQGVSRRPSAAASKRRARYRMSAAAKKAHSERMKAYWAAKKKAKK